MRLAAFVLCFFALTGIVHAEEWGAIAIDNDGLSYAGWRRSSMEEARDSQMKRCTDGSSLPHTCAWQSANDNHWAVSVYCRTEDGTRQGFVTWGKTAPQAISNVYKKAVAEGTPFGKNDCKIQNLITGNGSHNKHKQEE